MRLFGQSRQGEDSIAALVITHGHTVQTASIKLEQETSQSPSGRHMTIRMDNPEVEQSLSLELQRCKETRAMDE